MSWLILPGDRVAARLKSIPWKVWVSDGPRADKFAAAVFRPKLYFWLGAEAEGL